MEPVKIQLSVNEFLKAYDALASVRSPSLPISVSLQIVENLKQIKTIKDLFETQRQAIYEQHGKRSEDGMQLSLLKENIEKVNKMLIDKANEVVSISIHPIDIEVLKLCNVDIAPEALLVEWFFKAKEISKETG